MRGVAVVVLLAGCNSILGIESFAPDAAAVDDQVIDESTVDSAPFVPLHLTPETGAPGTGDLKLGGGTIDTTALSYGAEVDGVVFEAVEPGGPELAVLRVRSLVVDGTTVVTGSRPLVIVASGDITISGALDASARRAIPGPGGAAPSSGDGQGGDGAHTGLFRDSGGGGAGFGTDGGDGGDARCPNNMCPPLAGGSGGMGGGDLVALLRGGSGGGVPAMIACGQATAGAGGGAIQLSTPGSITVLVDGQLLAGGGGGGGGVNCMQTGMNWGAGAGGGSGGAIVLQGFMVVVAGTVAANGGAGGSGAGDPSGVGTTVGTRGIDGLDGLPSALRATGGTSVGKWSAIGGDGGAVTGPLDGGTDLGQRQRWRRRWRGRQDPRRRCAADDRHDQPRAARAVIPDLQRVLEEADARQLASLVEDWAGAGGVRRWIARAIRIDLALLHERPELVIPCLDWRCSSLGTAGEALVYREGVARGGIEDHAELRSTIAAWVETWGRGRRWLRAVRPPAVPLDGALREEYRTAATGALFAIDDDIVGIGDVAWDRTTGRRTVGVALPKPPDRQGWRLDRMGSRWEVAALVDHRGRSRSIALDEDEQPRGAFVIDGDLVLVSADYAEGGSSLYLVDAKSGERIWRAEGDAHAIVAEPDAIVIAEATRITRRARASGAVLDAFACNAPSELCLAHGSIITRHGPIVRVWDRDEAFAVSQASHPLRRTFFGAAISPDGTRAMSNTLLCEARTGRPIQRFDDDFMSGPDGWLENGPPRNCAALVDGAIVEITPFTVTVWASETGGLVRSERTTRISRIDDLAAHDPNGVTYAVWRGSGAPALDVYDVITGEVVISLVPDLVAGRDGRELWYSDDGERLYLRTPNGCRALVIARRELVVVEDPEPPPVQQLHAVTGGVVVHDGLAMPCDDERLVVQGDVLVGITAHLVVQNGVD